MGILRSIAWIACVLYASVPIFWFLVHPFAPRWRAAKRSPYILLVPAWSLSWIILFAATWRWRGELLFAVPWTWLFALPLLLFGWSVYRRAGGAFTRAHLLGQNELRADGAQELVTSGLRARVRHPIYAAHLLNLLAWSVGSGLLVNLALFVFALVAGTLMVMLEERELEQRFGEAYREYKQRVPAIFPKMG